MPLQYFFNNIFFQSGTTKQPLLFFQKIAHFTKKVVILNKSEIALTPNIYVDFLY